MPREQLEVRTAALADALGGRVDDGQSTIGAGSVPGMTIPSPVVVLADEDHLFQCLLQADEPVLARRETGSLVIDLRAVDPESDQTIIETVHQCR